MVRVKQFADDLGISKNQAKNLINKGRSRKDGGSQILENVMKPKGYKPGGVNRPIPKVKIEKLDRTLSKAEKDYLKAIAKANTYVPPKTKANTAGVDEARGDNKKGIIPSPKKKPVLKAALERLKTKDKAPISKREAGGSINKNIVSIDVNKTPGNLSTQKKIQSAIKGKSLKTSDVNKMTNNDIKPLLNKRLGGSSDFGMLSVKAGIDKNPNATQADRIAGATKNMRGGGMAIQGLGFTGVK